MDMPQLRVAKNLSKAIKDRRLSVAKLSEASKVPTKTIYHWLAGQVPNIIGLYKVSQSLGISMEVLAFSVQDAEEMGPWLRKCRERVRLTLSEAARKANISSQTLDLMESGEREPDLLVIATLAVHYQISPAVLSAKIRSVGKSWQRL